VPLKTQRNNIAGEKASIGEQQPKKQNKEKGKA